jgi:hypothetical protein
MESADFNQQLFSKLIREQRTTRSDETDTIIIDDMVLSEDECILNGWNTHPFPIYGMPVLFFSMLDRFPRSKVLSLFSCCSGYHLPCDLVLHRWKMDGSPKEPSNALYKEM